MPSVAQFELAQVYFKQSKFAEITKILGELLGVYRRTLSLSHPRIGDCLFMLCECGRMQDTLDAAKEFGRKAVTVYTESLSIHHESTAR